MGLLPDENFLTLQQALDAIGRAVQRALPERFWIVAEIAQVSSSKGHTYLELVQKEPGGVVVAKTRANIWQSAARQILGGFTAATGQSLTAGMNVLTCVSATFHPVFGFSLQVQAIDSDYTLGEMARDRRKVLDRLTREGLIESNKKLLLPLVVQRIAIVSSRTAAGYEDFCRQIEGNARGFCFRCTLFEAVMQGDSAEVSIIQALQQVRAQVAGFDTVVLIRGGGSKIDLHCFDGYALAREIAGFPLPVITGIGHERDDSVADIVAHHRCKTPTAVAEFLILRACEFDERLQELQGRLVTAACRRLESCRNDIERSARCLQSGVMQVVHRQAQTLGTVQEGVRTAALLRVERERGGLERVADKVKLLDPITVLRRGYSLVYHTTDGGGGGSLVRSIQDVRQGQNLQVQTAAGAFGATVSSVDTAAAGVAEGTV